MASLLQTQQEILSQFARDNDALKCKVDVITEELIVMRQEISNLKSSEATVGHFPHLPTSGYMY